MLEYSKQGWASGWREEENTFQGKSYNIPGATALFYITFSFFPLSVFPLWIYFYFAFLYLSASKRIDEPKNFPLAMATVLLCLSNFVWPLIIAEGVLFFCNTIYWWSNCVKWKLILCFKELKQHSSNKNIHKILFFH